MPDSRQPPKIPDHEVLRKIGSGSYGEVWLARSVTGAMRAVKVVHREDFDDEKTFLREFEGILHYEPISRNHPGLVHILHVGRHEGESGFYFYVMELGDDAYTGSEIDPSSYYPRTLQSDRKLTGSRPLPVAYTVNAGIQIARALGYLHSHGRIHRDIKPSNIIFVDDHPKLADIGLVDILSQKAIAGTEGFIPPEGPGDASGDIYALGKCLYEAATGLDRLEFPSLPDEIPTGAERRPWLRLNRIICATCDSQKKRRKYTSARALQAALAKLQPRTQSRNTRNAVLASLGVLAVIAVTWSYIQPAGKPPEDSVKSAPEADPGHLMITSYPPGALIYDQNGNFIGQTPYGPISLPAGNKVGFTLRHKGYRDLVETGTIESGKTLGIGGRLAEFAPPDSGMPWNDALNARYLPEPDDAGSDRPTHISSTPISLSDYGVFLKEAPGNHPSPRAVLFDQPGKTLPVKAVAITRQQATEFARWLTTKSRSDSLLDDYQMLEPVAVTSGNYKPLPHIADATLEEPAVSSPDKPSPATDPATDVAQNPPANTPAPPLPENVRPYRMAVVNVAPARLSITSQPSKARVYLYKTPIGQTPLNQAEIPPGNYVISVKLAGYAPKTFEGYLQPGADISLSTQLTRDGSVCFGEEWSNSLGMPFLPFSPSISVAKFETRVADFKAFLDSNPNLATPYSPPDFDQDNDHPAVNVSRSQARAFARWLTQRERSLGRIGPNDTYRLPSDYEWTTFNGIPDEPGLTPYDRDKPDDDRFSWGTIWPPDKLQFKVGNLADHSALENFDSSRVIKDYDDGYPHTSPVGKFPAGPFGLHDLSGNAQEWVSDDYGGPESFKFRSYGVVRGGSWSTSSRRQLPVRARTILPADLADPSTGFRLVLERTLSDP